MRKIIVLAGITLICASTAFAYSSPWEKLRVGTKQVLTGPFKIITVPVKQIDGRQHDQVLGVLGGLMEGATQTVVVPLKGIYNIVTFPIVDRQYSYTSPP